MSDLMTELLLSLVMFLLIGIAAVIIVLAAFGLQELLT